MNRQFSFQQYRAIDLGLFAVILWISETLIVTAATRWFADQLYTVSVVGALVAIVLMRWGVWAGIHAALGGLVFSLLSHGSLQQVVIYCAGNLFSLLMLLPLKYLGKERIRSDGGAECVLRAWDAFVHAARPRARRLRHGQRFSQLPRLFHHGRTFPPVHRRDPLGRPAAGRHF